MPDVTQLALPEVSACLDIVVSNIRNYDIKKLLLDSSKSVIEAEDEAYKAVTTKFGLDLMNTRLKKIARVATTDTKREAKSAQVSAELRRELNLPIEFRNFSNQADAMEWLLER